MPRKEFTFSKNTLREEPAVSENKETVPKKETPVKEKISKPKKEKKQKKSSIGIIDTIKSDKFQKVLGLFLLLSAFYLLIAFTSYLFSWKVDDNIPYNPSHRVLTDNSLLSENWMGKIGAVVSYLFIKKWFGVASYLFMIWIFLVGIKLFINVTLFPLGKATKYVIFALIWISVTTSFFLRSEDYGGSFGYQVNTWLYSVIGKIGAGILLFYLDVFCQLMASHLWEQAQY